MTTITTTSTTSAAPSKDELLLAAVRDVLRPLLRQTASADAMRLVARFCRYRGYAKPLVIGDVRGGHLATSLDFGQP